MFLIFLIYIDVLLYIEYYTDSLEIGYYFDQPLGPEVFPTGMTDINFRNENYRNQYGQEYR